jgi:hypothetical protein
MNDGRYIMIKAHLAFVQVTGTRGTELPPPFLNILFTYLFSIKFLLLFHLFFLNFTCS